jgi:hypothetical protein
MACVSYCDEALQSHNTVDCNVYALGGSPAMIVGACGTTLTDPSDEAEIQALIDAGTATLIEDVRLALPAGSPVTVDSPIGCGSPIRINEDRTMTIFDANVTDENVDFFDDLNNRKLAWVLLYLCDSGKVVYINPPQGITSSVQFIIPEQNNELQRFEGVLSWRDKSIPKQYPAPNGIF